MKSSRFVFALAALTLLYSSAQGKEPEIRIVGDSNRPQSVEVVGLAKSELAELARLPADDPTWARKLAVYVADDSPAKDQPAMVGSYAVEGTALRFTPTYSLRPGTKYRVVYRPVAASGSPAGEITKEVAIPARPPGEPARITAIYPSSSTLPDNQLRFYIHFSAPMSSGGSYRHIKLLKTDGTPVNKAFYELGEELWDGAGQRFTLLCDPGRVKKGLKPREEFGPVLEAGQTYRLVIDKDWRDEHGQPLAAGFEKRFTAGPPVEAAVDYQKWRISPPPAGSRDPLIVRFDRPLDRALLRRMITVADQKGKAIDGEIAVEDEERRWEFKPDQAWPAGSFALVVDTALEDSAGNNLARPFEIDVFDKVDEKPGPDFVRIPFTIGGKK
jgi:hypothetical protein